MSKTPTKLDFEQRERSTVQSGAQTPVAADRKLPVMGRRVVGLRELEQLDPVGVLLLNVTQ